VRCQVLAILPERHRRGAHVLALLEEEQRAPAPFVGDAIAERRAAHDRAARHLAQVGEAERLEHRLDDGELEAQPAGELLAGEVGAEVQVFEHQLQDEIVRQASLGQRRRRLRAHRYRSRGHRGGRRRHFVPPLFMLHA
jgi:hypothetical protein